jgi:hypothetical protein
MSQKSVEEIFLLVESFEKRVLPKEEWTHRTHLIIGLVYCCLCPLDRARVLMGNGIFWLNVAHGTPNNESSGYHETLTVFWLKLIYRFLELRSPSEDLATLAKDLTADFNNPRLPLKYYTPAVLFSPYARETYVHPDLREVWPVHAPLSLPPGIKIDALNFLNTATRSGGYTVVGFP